MSVSNDSGRLAISCLDSLQLTPASFEVALSIETLYFVHDLERTLAAVHRILVPGLLLRGLLFRQVRRV
jgi:hypothetical protein